MTLLAPPSPVSGHGVSILFSLHIKNIQGAWTVMKSTMSNTCCADVHKLEAPGPCFSGSMHTMSVSFSVCAWDWIESWHSHVIDIMWW
ncbi:hypothetical protein D5086_022581 [Populus alba]|uniref:Uncharacterized protein n=1 Tax=Populus alba TaxID=43335 RepID=A0ACC4BFF3_POPAL